jgi:hypothetical protein
VTVIEEARRPGGLPRRGCLSLVNEVQAEIGRWLAILAEILARRAGRRGGPLKEAKGRIHAAAEEAPAPR